METINELTQKTKYLHIKVGDKKQTILAEEIEEVYQKEGTQLSMFENTKLSALKNRFAAIDNYVKEIYEENPEEQIMILGTKGPKLTRNATPIKITRNGNDVDITDIFTKENPLEGKKPEDKYKFIITYAINKAVQELIKKY